MSLGISGAGKEASTNGVPVSEGEEGLDNRRRSEF
jgi:hypothetical protein